MVPQRKAPWRVPRALPRVAVVTGALALVLGCGDGSATDPDGLNDPLMITKFIDVPPEVVTNSTKGVKRFAGAPTVLFLNFDGVTITKGSSSNATTNTSFIGGGTVPPFSGTEAEKQQAVTLIKQLYARYNVQVVTTRPSSGYYDMTVIGGTPAHLGLSYGSSVMGVAPMDCYNRMPSDVHFCFADNIRAYYPSGSALSQRVAETSSHEAGHVYGLPHTGDGCDLMSYSKCSVLKTFLDKTIPMQSDSYGTCGFTQINTDQELLKVLGASTGQTGDTAAPTVTITSPAAGATVSSPLTVRATISDDTGVAKAELLVDGTTTQTLTASPWDFTVTLAAGAHALLVRGHDAAGNTGVDSVSVNVSGGSSEDTTAPTVSITSPADGATVGTTLNVHAAATDDTAVTQVELRVDAKLAQTLTATPYSFQVSLAVGTSALQVTAYDAAGNKGYDTATVTVQAGGPSGPATAPGAFGEACAKATQCISSLCLTDAQAGTGYCTQACDDATACPTGYACGSSSIASFDICAIPAIDRAHTAGGDLGGPTLLGGCAVGGADRGLPLAPLLALLLLLILRRRRGR